MDENFNDHEEENCQLIASKPPPLDDNKNEEEIGLNKDLEEIETNKRSHSIVDEDKLKLLNENDKIPLNNHSDVSLITKADEEGVKILYEKINESVTYYVLKEDIKEDKNPVIISLVDLPRYKNFFITVHPFIINGYRINHSLNDCLKSVFKLHNETFNIWTHLFPFFIFLSLFIYNVIGI
jgi:hypothetical protein